MPTYADSRVNPPKSWDEFEDIVCSAAKNRWTNPDFTRNGRQGQAQAGVDVYGRDHNGRLVGLQCKNSLAGISLKTIQTEVGNAEGFQPSLHHLYLATTAPTDATLQKEVRALSADREKQGSFGVSVLFWGDIWQDLTRDESRLFQHYPQLRPVSSVPTGNAAHDQQLFEEFQTLFGYEPAIRLLRDHDFGGAFPKLSIRPLYAFVETWDQPEKEFLDPELQAELKALYVASLNMATHLVGKTVPIGDGTFVSVYPDAVRNEGGPRPDWVIEDARELNNEAQKFVPIYESFLRFCRQRLAR